MSIKKISNYFYVGLFFVMVQACKMEYVNPNVFPPVITFDSVGTVNYNSGTNIFSVQGFGRVTALGNTHLYERGFIFDDTNAVPSVENSDNIVKLTTIGLGSFNGNVTALPPARTVFIRTYSLYYKGVSYSEVKTVETSKSRPVVTASMVDTNQVTSTTARFKGVLVFTGGENVTEQGFVFSTSQNPTVSDSRIDAGNFTEGSPFSAEASGLTPDRTYFVRAFAINSLGTTYSSQVSFRTKKQ
jgi:hypothetical protein